MLSKNRRLWGNVSFLRSAEDRVQLDPMGVSSSRVPEPGIEVGLRGRLEQFGLATVLTFLDLERRSGELTLLGDGEVGRLWLRQGQVIRARRPAETICRASCGVSASVPNRGKSGVRPLPARRSSRYFRMSSRNRSPNAACVNPSRTARATTSRIVAS